MLEYAVRSRSSRGVSSRTVLSALLLLGIAAPAWAQEAAEPPIKIGVINLDAVALQSPAGQALQQEIADFQAALSAELQSRSDAARAIEQQVAEADSLSEDTRRALERQYQDALTDFQRFQQDKQEEANALRANGIARIQEEIAPVIEAIQVELGYDIVLNSTNTLIVIFSERVDITDLVIERLQSGGA